MRYRQLGHSGLTVSVVGLGCNNVGGRIDVAASRSVVDAALDDGATLLDTSNTYGNKGDRRPPWARSSAPVGTRWRGPPSGA